MLTAGYIGHLYIVKLLVQHGADIDLVDDQVMQHFFPHLLLVSLLEIRLDGLHYSGHRLMGILKVLNASFSLEQIST